MPCTGGYSTDDGPRISRYLDVTTRLLCDALAKLPDSEKTDEQKRWQAQHARVDAARLAYEAAQAEGDKRRRIEIAERMRKAADAIAGGAEPYTVAKATADEALSSGDPAREERALYAHERRAMESLYEMLRTT